MSTFLKELEQLINKYSIENESDTPDFILAEYLNNCLYSYNLAVSLRENWFGRKAINPEWLKLPRENSIPMMMGKPLNVGPPPKSLEQGPV